MKRLALALILVSGYTRATQRVGPSFELSRYPFSVDSARTSRIAPGITHDYVYSNDGPWAIHMLTVERSSCVDFRALKARGTAAGRERTTAMLDQLASTEPVVAGVNADFFSLATGVPQTAHVQKGRVIAGPTARPVLAFDSSGTPFIGVLSTRGRVTLISAEQNLNGWNRVIENGLAVFDDVWGAATDSGSGRIEVIVAPGQPMRVLATDTLPAGVAIPPTGAILVAGRTASPQVRRALSELRQGDAVAIERAIGPVAPREVVGGWPIIVRNGQITTAADSSGATFAPVRHPRTAVGLLPDGRLVFVVVDGRQKPYSDGMTLRELARLYLALGAREVLNLDGGGSSTFVARDTTGARRIHNKPSDKVERPVSNALAVISRC